MQPCCPTAPNATCQKVDAEDGGYRTHRSESGYDETIDKIVVEPGDLERMCAAAGVGPVAWRSDDLVTSIEHPEQHAVVFGIAGPTA